MILLITDKFKARFVKPVHLPDGRIMFKMDYQAYSKALEELLEELQTGV